MKNVVFLTLMLFASLIAYSQTENFNSDFVVRFGFNVGLNYSNLLTKEKLPENSKIYNGAGLRMGIIMDYKISELFLLSPKAELSFNNSSVEIVNSNSTSIFPTSLDFMAHIVYRRGKVKFMPYVYCGPDFKWAVKNQTNNQPKYDFAIDFGIGIDNQLKYFVFAPELRYSFGLLNVNQNLNFQTLNFHNIALVLNFK